MKSALLLFLGFALASTLPYRDTIALLNSLQVGRDENPQLWQCFGCDAQTKPKTSYIIEDSGIDIKAILSVYEDYTVLAFRYTATALNIFQDILYAIQIQDEHSCKGCKVQKQFNKMWNSIKDRTMKELRKHSLTQKLLISGISLGGALACLSYVDISEAKIFADIEIVTFGAPRVGNKKWAAWFNQKTPSTRYFLKGDPIPVLPRCLTFLCNYGYTGTPVKCDKSTNICTGNQHEGFEFEDMTDLADMTYDGLTEPENDTKSGGGGSLGIIDHIFEYKNLKEYTLEILQL